MEGITISFEWDSFLPGVFFFFPDFPANTYKQNIESLTCIKG